MIAGIVPIYIFIIPMSDFQTFLFVLSLSILLPFLSWLFCRKNMDPSYWPFIALIILGVVTELASRWSIRMFDTNAIVINIYSLLECLLIIAQFYCWRGNKQLRRRYLAVAVITGLIWCTENIVRGYLIVQPVFRISYAFAIVILSINEINYLITHASRQLLRNARFLICLGFLVFFLYQILLEGALFISTPQNHVSDIFKEMYAYINTLVNITYAIAIWFIPKRSTFTFPIKPTSDR